EGRRFESDRWLQVFMRHFIKPNPNAAHPETRRREVRNRLLLGASTVGMTAVSMSVYKNSETFGPKFGSLMFGIIGGLATSLVVLNEVAERYPNPPAQGEGDDGGNGGGGWEPPEGPEPHGPGGIPEHETDWIHEVEEYLDTKQPVSV